MASWLWNAVGKWVQRKNGYGVLDLVFNLLKGNIEGGMVFQLLRAITEITTVEDWIERWFQPGQV